MLVRDRYRHRIQQLIQPADVLLDGDRPWDMQVHDPQVFIRLLVQGSLGLGESYMEGRWDSADLDGLLYRLLQARIDDRAQGLIDVLDAVKAWLLNQQDLRHSREVGKRHYDLGNDLYAAMLGRRMVYSCGYWQRADNLDDAQLAKLDLVCRKLGLQPGMRVLDIGCGWGEALKYAAEHYGVTGVGITISREQAAYARDLCAQLPVEIRLQDYRALDETFDRAFSIGMFEHVGYKNYRTFFDVARHTLVADGLFLLHCIGGNRSRHRTDPWIARYVFPNSMLPSAAQIARACEGRFVIEDWHSFGPDYDLTLQAWRRNIDAAWDRLSARYDQCFRRMWHFYLAASMASFRARRSQLWQLLLSPHGLVGGCVAQR